MQRILLKNCATKANMYGRVSDYWNNYEGYGSTRKTRSINSRCAFFFSRKETTCIQTDSRIRRTFSRPNYQHSWIYELVKSCGNSPIILTKQETFSLHFGRNINECHAMKKFRLEAVSRKMGTTVIGSLFNGNATLRHFVIQVTLSNFKVNYITKKYIEPQTICIYPP